MPGFSEYGMHNSEFDRTISKREARSRALENACYNYLESLGLTSGYLKYKLTGNTLSFYYNCGNNTFKHIVNLSTKEFRNVRSRVNKRCSVVYDCATNRFYFIE